jgi:stage V sporulation protein S
VTQVTFRIEIYLVGFLAVLDFRTCILYNEMYKLIPIAAILTSHYSREHVMDTNNVDIIKVSATSRTSAVAGAIAGIFRERQFVNVQAIGASAVNQAVKALALARDYLTEDGYDIVSIPEFVDVEIDGNIRTAIRLNVVPR